MLFLCAAAPLVFQGLGVIEKEALGIGLWAWLPPVPLLEFLSDGSHLGSSPVRLCCDGYTLQHLIQSRQGNEKIILALREQDPSRFHPAVLFTEIQSYSCRL